MLDITNEKHLKEVSILRDLLAEFQKNEDLINIGAYNPGMNPKLDKAMKLLPKIEAFLKQDRTVVCNFKDSLNSLHDLTGEGET